MISDKLDLIQCTVGPSVRIDTAGASDPWSAVVDPSERKNALLNHCITGRDAMPDGGQITIETANCLVDNYASKQRDLPEGQYLVLSSPILAPACQPTPLPRPSIRSLPPSRSGRGQASDYQ